MNKAFVVLAQAMGEGPGFNIDIQLGLGGGAFGVFLTTLLVGALLVALAPAYTDRMKRSLTEEPIDSFIYGVLALVGLILVTFLLVLTIIGIFVVVPLAITAYVLWAVGSAIAFLLIGERIVDAEDWKLPLLVGAAINGALALTGIGGLVSFCIGAAGFGAVLRDLLA
ncbi:hypothetical protein [Halobacteriaceae bacterium SHR40]|uniref:hypothetical protein n=1 Tax=Halovenus amylolytica TaxID=2500550 RepID=UPI000FE29F2C